MSISPEQMTAALSLLKMTQGQLSEATGISPVTISFLLGGKGTRETKESTRQKVIDYLCLQGIEFIDDGVRKKPSIVELGGTEGFRTFMDDVYEIAKESGGDICLFNSKPSLWIKYLGQEWYDMHAKRMADLGDRVRVRIVVEEGEKHFILGLAEHRWLSNLKWKQKIVYAYGGKLGFLDFSNDDIKITVMSSAAFNESFRVMFDIAWDSAAKIPKGQ